MQEVAFNRRDSISLYHSKYKLLRSMLRMSRESAGLTQAQLALALGVGQSYVSKLERGENFVDVMLFVRWLHVCGLKPSVFLDELLSPNGSFIDTERH